MKGIVPKTLIFMALFLAATLQVFPQDPPPAARSRPITTTALPALTDISTAERFLSTEGAFSIALPKSISGYSPMPSQKGMNASGSSYNWRFREGTIIVSYREIDDASFRMPTDKDDADFFAGYRDSILAVTKGTVTSDRTVKLGTVPGHEYVFRLPSGQSEIARAYVHGNQIYSLLAILSPNVSNAEELIAKVFGSLTLIDRTTIDADIRKRVEEATPEQLPQDPVATKERSDADDEGLRGAVKTLTEEQEDLSGTWQVQGRHFSSITDFNERGNRTKQIFYDSKAKPYEVRAYGYIDGARVFKSGMIDYESDPQYVRQWFCRRSRQSHAMVVIASNFFTPIETAGLPKRRCEVMMAAFG
jgi:hypothetical protein